jgi:asparagine synthase (glutamine-hydrolysing)
LFKTESDTETLVHGYEEWGEGVARHLRGMFAYALWDARGRGRLTLARDHFGIKPLFYMVTDGALFFASEIKALLLHPRVKRKMDLRALDEYLSFLYVAAPRTMFEGIFELPPAHSLIVEGGAFRVERYWKPEARPQAVDEGAARELVRGAFEESVRAQLMSDVPLGAFLSGGIDSAAIVAMMKRHTDAPVKTFSLGFGRAEERWDESAAAARAAAFYGTEHHAFRIEPDVVALAPQVVAQFDQPFANPTAVLMLLLARETRKHVKVALAGTGGDELFGGYPRYAGMLALEMYQRAPQAVRSGLARGARATLKDGSNGNLRTQRVRRFLEGGALSFEECYVRWLTATDPARKGALYTRETRARLGDTDAGAVVRGYLTEEGTAQAERLMTTDFQTYLPYNQLAYADRMSMAASLEVRVPFVDQVLFAAVKDIPLAQKVGGGTTKRLFRQALAKDLPPFLVNLPKTGLNLPIAHWFRGALRGWVRERLAPEKIRARGLFEASAIEQTLAEHEAGRRDHSLALWALVMLELWQEMYVDGG